MRRAVCRRSLGPLLVLSLGWAAAAREYELKAAYLITFAQFVIWPDEAFAGSNAPVAIGILGEDPGQSGRLFQSFSQVDVSTTRKFCRLTGGDVTVESALGEGSTFTLRAPRHLASLGGSYA